MAIEDFFDHKCDIYHLTGSAQKRGYGLPDSRVYQYPEQPDISGQPCHFSVKSGNVAIIRQEPQKELDASHKLTLPNGTDIRVSDRIVDCDTGYEYEAEVPRNIRGHHIAVMVRRVHPKAI